MQLICKRYIILSRRRKDDDYGRKNNGTLCQNESRKEGQGGSYFEKAGFEFGYGN